MIHAVHQVLPLLRSQVVCPLHRSSSGRMSTKPLGSSLRIQTRSFRLLDLESTKPASSSSGRLCRLAPTNSSAECQNGIANIPSRQSHARSMTSSSPSSALSSSLPRGTWDSHMHVVSADFDRYPLSPSAQYTPPSHTLSEARSFYKTHLDLESPNMVFVQPSIYGTDNSCMLDALQELGKDRGRAVVEIDPQNIEKATLEKWHTIGVRGVRVNLVSVGKVLDEQGLRRELQAYTAVMKSFEGGQDWVAELYVPLRYTNMLTRIVPDLGVKVCLDHFGGLTFPTDTEFVPDDPTTSDPYRVPFYSDLVDLVKAGKTWIKLSGPYRITKDKSGKMRDLDPIGRELMDLCSGERVVWASDWPHTRFGSVDSRPFVELCHEWCGNGSSGMNRREKLFRSNAQELWDAR